MLSTTLSTEAVTVDGRTENYHEGLRLNLVHSLEFEDGLKQSPIDLDIGAATSLNLPPLKWSNYDRPARKLKLINTGNTVLLRGKWKPEERPTVSNGPLRCEHEFTQMHFHWHAFNAGDGSEHTVEGKRLPFEMHAVHYKSGYQSLKMALGFNDPLFVIGCFFQLQAFDNPRIAPLSDVLEQVQQPGTAAMVEAFPLTSILPPFADDYLVYWGAITPGKHRYRMLWAISRRAVGISIGQLSKFQTIMCTTGTPMNSHLCRVSPRLDRVVFHVQGSSSCRATLLPFTEAVTVTSQPQVEENATVEETMHTVEYPPIREKRSTERTARIQDMIPVEGKIQIEVKMPMREETSTEGKIRIAEKTPLRVMAPLEETMERVAYVPAMGEKRPTERNIQIPGVRNIQIHLVESKIRMKEETSIREKAPIEENSPIEETMQTVDYAPIREKRPTIRKIRIEDLTLVREKMPAREMIQTGVNMSIQGKTSTKEKVLTGEKMSTQGKTSVEEKILTDGMMSTQGNRSTEEKILTGGKMSTQGKTSTEEKILTGGKMSMEEKVLTGGKMSTEGKASTEEKTRTEEKTQLQDLTLREAASFTLPKSRTADVVVLSSADVDHHPVATRLNSVDSTKSLKKVTVFDDGQHYAHDKNAEPPKGVDLTSVYKRGEGPRVVRSNKGLQPPPSSREWYFPEEEDRAKREERVMGITMSRDEIKPALQASRQTSAGQQNVDTHFSLRSDQLACYLQPADLHLGRFEIRTFPPLAFLRHFAVAGEADGDATFTNRLHCVEVTLKTVSPPVLSGGPLLKGLEYVFVAMHVYWVPNQYPTKYRLQGKQHEIEIRLLYFMKSVANSDQALRWPHGFCYVGFFVEAMGSEENPHFTELLSSMRSVTSPNASCAASSRVLQVVRDYVRPRGYMTFAGSFAHAPRTEVITWIIYSDPIPVTQEQVDEFRRLSQEANTKLAQTSKTGNTEKTIYRSI